MKELELGWKNEKKNDGRLGGKEECLNENKMSFELFAAIGRGSLYFGEEKCTHAEHNWGKR